MHCIPFSPLIDAPSCFIPSLLLCDVLGVNGTGQIADLPGLISGLIDPDTPESVKTRTGFDGKKYELVFSDEFNVDGRTFYPGDDPFWEAVDLHYWVSSPSYPSFCVQLILRPDLCSSTQLLLGIANGGE